MTWTDPYTGDRRSDPNDMVHVTSQESTPANTKDLGEAFCPRCEPERSVFDKREDGKVYYEKFCGNHDPGHPKGDADDEAKSHGIGDGYLGSSSAAVGSESNRAACDIIHHRQEEDDERA